MLEMDTRSSSLFKILVIEDSIDIRLLLEQLLNSEGYQVLFAEDGHQGLKQLQSIVVPPNLILLDMMMPVMDGFEFLEARKRQKHLSQIPVTIMTADGQMDGKVHSLGVQAYVRKPFDIDELLKTIRRFCS